MALKLSRFVLVAACLCVIVVTGFLLAEDWQREQTLTAEDPNTESRHAAIDALVDGGAKIFTGFKMIDYGRLDLSEWHGSVDSLRESLRTLDDVVDTSGVYPPFVPTAIILGPHLNAEYASSLGETSGLAIVDLNGAIWDDEVLKRLQETTGCQLGEVPRGHH